MPLHLPKPCSVTAYSISRPETVARALSPRGLPAAEYRRFARWADPTAARAARAAFSKARSQRVQVTKIELVINLKAAKRARSLYSHSAARLRRRGDRVNRREFIRLGHVSLLRNSR